MSSGAESEGWLGTPDAVQEIGQFVSANAAQASDGLQVLPVDRRTLQIARAPGSRVYRGIFGHWESGDGTSGAIEAANSGEQDREWIYWPRWPARVSALSNRELPTFPMGGGGGGSECRERVA